MLAQCGTTEITYNVYKFYLYIQKKIKHIYQGNKVYYFKFNTSNMSNDFNVSLEKHFISTPTHFFNLLENELKYPSKKISCFKIYNVPRLVTAYGDSCEITYSYSGTKKKASLWTPTLFHVKDLVEKKTGFKYNFCLVNKYRNGYDSIGKHRDDEMNLVETHPIACVSLGETRTIIFSKSGCKNIKFNLNSGSLLVMYSPTNQNWYHEIQKEPQKNGIRISLTFRLINTKNFILKD